MLDRRARTDSAPGSTFRSGDPQKRIPVDPSLVPWVKALAEGSAALAEAIGVALIVVLALYALAYGAWQRLKRSDSAAIYHEVRVRLGRGILLGLEFLVAADIIHTVAVELTLEAVAVLAAVVLIRTFLSFALEVELNGRWPWQGRD